MSVAQKWEKNLYLKPSPPMNNPAHSDESAFVARLQSGDAKGMEELYDRYSPALFGVISRIVGDSELAEDVLQEVFVKIWKNLPHYDASKGRLFTWMMNIARNSAIDMVRLKGYKQAQKVQSLDTAVYTDPKSEPNISEIGVRELVEQLQPEQRKIIDLIYFKGYTQSEVSKTLSLPLGTIKSRVRIAMREMRKVFNLF